MTTSLLTIRLAFMWTSMIAIAAVLSLEVYRRLRRRRFARNLESILQENQEIRAPKPPLKRAA